MNAVCVALDDLLENTTDADLDGSIDNGEELQLNNITQRVTKLINSLEQYMVATTSTIPTSQDGSGDISQSAGDPNIFTRASFDYNNRRKERSTNVGNGGNAYAKFRDTTVREMFAYSNSPISRTPPLLASLMMTRVETEKLLPPTQDAEANEEAMKSVTAIMLTRPALLAALLYSTLLTIPGALGSGLIEMEAVSSLAALFRRWRVESVTAVDLVVTSNTLSKSKTGKPKSSKRKSSNRTATNPIKRGRVRRHTVVFAANASTDEESDVESVDVKARIPIVQQDSGSISPCDLLLLGLQAARSLSEVPMHKEFMSWSSEAREALLDAVTSLYGTICALVTPSVRPKLDERIVLLQEDVVHRATTCLSQCVLKALVICGDDDGYDDTQGTFCVSTKRHETSIFLFRGLYPVMAMREHLPNGEAGRQIACEKAAELLQRFVKCAKEDLAQDHHTLWTSGGAGPLTPARALRSSVHLGEKYKEVELSATPKTISKKGRKKRVSFGGAMEASCKTPMLRSGNKTPRQVLYAATPFKSPDYTGTKPRPVLSVVLGLMQKLATNKGMDRASLRSTTVKSLQCCLQHLPTPERTCMLRFINQLTYSKVSVHRLTGADLLGHVLTETWLWTCYTNQSMITPEPQIHRPIPATPPSKTAQGLPPGKSRENEMSNEISAPVPNKEGHDIPSSLLAALIGRLADRASAVRACAAGSLGFLFAKIFSTAEGGPGNENLSNISPVELRNVLGKGAYDIANSLRERASADEKATVRKTSIEALTQLMLLGTLNGSFPFGINEENVVVIGLLCNDSSLLARKAAAQGLTTLLARCTTLGDRGDNKTIDLVSQTWCFSVLPMVLDAESGCVAKAVELFHEVVIQPLVLEDDDNMFDHRAYKTAWRILALVSESSNGSAKNMTGALKTAITKIAGPDSLHKGATKALLRRICDIAVQTIDVPTDELFHPELEALRCGVWCLFDALVDQTSKLSIHYQTLEKLGIDVNFLGTSWEKLMTFLETPDLSKTSANRLRNCMKSCLRLLAQMASCVNTKTAHQSASNLQSMLQKFTLPPDLIGPAVAALASTSIVCTVGEDVDRVRYDCSERLMSLYKSCEAVISAYGKLLRDSDRQRSEAIEETNVRAIFMVGELSIVGFTPDENDALKVGNGKESFSKTDPLRGLNVPPSMELIDLVMTFLPGRMLGSDQTPEKARAHAFTCVGKICLRSGQEQLAKKCVVIFAREIHENFAGCPSVQSNALLVLGDLCCRYTNLVDRYLPVMATCLQSGVECENSIILTAAGDKSAIVRKNAILLLSSLLLQDYIKFRGLLFFRFLVASADNDDTVAQIGESVLVGPLLSKWPKLFFNNFVVSLFVLNSCMHPIDDAAKSAGNGVDGIAVDFEGIHLMGPDGRAKRFQMYELMLARMTDEEKIGITARLTKDVLGRAASASSGALHRVCISPKAKVDVDSAGDREYECAFNVMSDCFAILSCPLLRVGKRVQSIEDDADIIEDPNLPKTSRRLIAAKGKLLSKISRKHLIEIVFPILCSVKVVLQKSCSPLFKDLMEYMVYIFRGYSVEVKDFLSNDLNLLQEIEYDARKMGGTKTPGQKMPGHPSCTEDIDSPVE